MKIMNKNHGFAPIAIIILGVIIIGGFGGVAFIF